MFPQDILTEIPEELEQYNNTNHVGFLEINHYQHNKFVISDYLKGNLNKHTYPKLSPKWKLATQRHRLLWEVQPSYQRFSTAPITWKLWMIYKNLISQCDHSILLLYLQASCKESRKLKNTAANNTVYILICESIMPTDGPWCCSPVVPVSNYTKYTDQNCYVLYL